MKNYYLNQNAQNDGYHEVHSSPCIYMPSMENRIYLGQYSNCKDAVKESKKYYAKTDGCYYCCKECHTR